MSPAFLVVAPLLKPKPIELVETSEDVPLLSDLGARGRIRLEGTADAMMTGRGIGTETRPCEVHQRVINAPASILAGVYMPMRTALTSDVVHLKLSVFVAFPRIVP